MNTTVPADAQAAIDAFQDGIIGRRLPPWLRHAPAEQLPEIGRALANSLRCCEQVNAMLRGIEGIDGFVASALGKALDERYGLGRNPYSLRFLQGRREAVINSQPVGAHLTTVVYEEQPLLEVAMRNFTAAQAQEGGQPRGNRLLVPTHGTVKPPTSIELAKLCRELDLGERYQRHLDSILKPAGSAEHVVARLVDALRYSMLVDAYKARQQGTLDDSELGLLVAVCEKGKLLRLAGDPVQARQLKLLGCQIEQVTVFAVVEQGVLFNTTRRVFLYVPGDPRSPWSVFESIDKMNRELGRRLRDKAYRRFFSRFVLRRDSQAFFAQVAERFDDLPDWAFRDLEPHLQAYPQPLFISQAQARIHQIKDDAAMIAVPVAKLDREVQRQHDLRLEAEGWALLNLASFFVPGLGLALLALTASELLKEVYHGVEAWHENDRQEALDHLTHVATDLAIVATTVAGVGVARRVWARSAKVDAMLPARLEDGTVKLWQQDLTPFQRQVPDAASSPDALGIRRQDGLAWIEMDGQHYRVTEAAGGDQWQLYPVDGHGPLLHHNGAGAWRLWSEQPAMWPDKYRMFRRLGEPFNRLNDEQIDQVLLFHGLDGDDVRGLHVHAQAPSPALIDSVERVQLDQRIRSMVGRLRSGEPVEDATVLDHVRRLPGADGLTDQALAGLAWAQRRTLLQHLFEALQPDDSLGSTALRRVFPGLNVRGAQALVQAASSVDRTRLLSSGRVALGLAEAARSSLLATRQARVFEALYLDTPQHADLARVVVGLLRYLPGGERGVGWRLYEGWLGGPMLAKSEQGQRAFDLVHLDGSFQLYDSHGTARGEAGELFDVMAPAYTDVQREAMGIGDPFSHNLRVMLGREAVRHRDQISRLLGAVRPGAVRRPMRLTDGRIGYPLGGGGVSGFASRGSALRATLRDLFPWLSDQQVETFADEARRSGQQLEHVLTSLRNEFAMLRMTLNTWVARAQGDVMDDREALRQTLFNCWRRSVGVGELQINAQENLHVMFCNFKPGGLPNIPVQVSFRGVTSLSLLHLDLLEVPSSLLLAFPSLHTLDLGGNLLTRLPQPLLQIEQLRHLSLTNNRIVLNIAQTATLASCASLQSLDLSHNPLGRFMLAGLTELRWLNLRDTQISQFPLGVFDNTQLVSVDLRDNRIRHIPESFFQLPVWHRRRFRLNGNPLGEAQTLRLQAALSSDDPGLDEEQVLLRLQRAREVWGDAVAPEHRGLMLAAWDSLDSGEDADRFFRVLRQLLLSEDFRVNARALGNRVMAVLQAMAITPELRQNLLSVANDEWGCQDGATWCLSNLELNLLVWQVEHAAQGESERALLDLGRRLWRHDAVDRFATRWALRHGRMLEGSEVGLAFRIGLRERLDLPLQVGEMSFLAISGVLEADLAEAEAAVRAAETPEEIARSMVDREFWQAHLERTHPDRFAAVDLPFRRQLETVLDDEALTEGARIDQADAIRDAQRAARRGLMLDMTTQAMEVRPTGPSIDVR